MNFTQTISPGANIPQGYFDEDNITFVVNKCSEIIEKEYRNVIILSRADIIRVMMRVLEERKEAVPRMNQRAIMYICNDFRTHQEDVNKHLKWEEGYTYSQQLIDPVGGISRFDNTSIKTKDRKKYDGFEKVGGTLRFHFT